MKFLDNWVKTHRKYSAQAMAGAIAIEGAWLAFNASGLAASQPPSLARYVGYVVIGLLSLGIFGGMIDQGSVTQPPPKDDAQ